MIDQKHFFHFPKKKHAKILKTRDGLDKDDN